MKRFYAVVILVALLISMFGQSNVVAAKKYYSASEIKVPRVKGTTYVQCIKIVSIKGNKITYRKCIYLPNSSEEEAKFGKKLTAKFTSKTKYYVGDVSRYDYSSSEDWYHCKSKWFKHVNRKEFKKYITKYANEAIRVKNGRVTKIYTNVFVAG